MKNLKKTIMEDGFLPINYNIILTLGIEVGMLLCLLIDKYELFNNKPFYYTVKSVEKEIKMNKKTFMKCKKILVEKGLVKSWNGEGNKTYFTFTPDNSENVMLLLGQQKSQKSTTEVPNKDIRSSKMELQKSQIDTTEVPKEHLNNNIKEELIIKTNNNNLEEELSNNNKEEKLTKNSVEYDEADMYINGNKKLKLEPTPSKPKNGIFDNIDI
jgi:hypothetical protein